jgi:hypothetical protein
MTDHGRWSHAEVELFSIMRVMLGLFDQTKSLPSSLLTVDTLPIARSSLKTRIMGVRVAPTAAAS